MHKHARWPGWVAVVLGGLAAYVTFPIDTTFSAPVVGVFVLASACCALLGAVVGIAVVLRARRLDRGGEVTHPRWPAWTIVGIGCLAAAILFYVGLEHLTLAPWHGIGCNAEHPHAGGGSSELVRYWIAAAIVGSVGVLLGSSLLLRTWWLERRSAIG
jgi:hypothetical protein